MGEPIKIEGSMGIGAKVTPVITGGMYTAGGISAGVIAKYNNIYAEAKATGIYGALGSVTFGVNPTLRETPKTKIGVEMGIGADAMYGFGNFNYDLESIHNVKNNSESELPVQHYIDGKFVSEKVVLPGQEGTFPAKVSGNDETKFQYDYRVNAGITFEGKRSKFSIGAMAACATAIGKEHTLENKVSYTDPVTGGLYDEQTRLSVGAEKTSKLLVSPYVSAKHCFDKKTQLTMNASLLGVQLGLDYKF